MSPQTPDQVRHNSREKPTSDTMLKQRNILSNNLPFLPRTIRRSGPYTISALTQDDMFPPGSSANPPSPSGPNSTRNGRNNPLSAFETFLDAIQFSPLLTETERDRSNRLGGSNGLSNLRDRSPSPPRVAPSPCPQPPHSDGSTVFSWTPALLGRQKQMSKSAPNTSSGPMNDAPNQPEKDNKKNDDR